MRTTGTERERGGGSRKLGWNAVCLSTAAMPSLVRYLSPAQRTNEQRQTLSPKQLLFWLIRIGFGCTGEDKSG